jgi:protein-arginine deiminase
MASPVLLCSSLDTVEALFVVETPRTQPLVEALKRLSPVPVHAIANDPAHASDVWMQDTAEFAVRDGKPVALLGLRGKHDMGLTCAPLDKLVETYLAEKLPSVERLKVGEPKAGRRWIDWYGNLEVSPPVPGFPEGRILTGKQRELSFHPEALAFLERQKAQWPPVFIDVSWLTIGHVDEVISFIPAPEKDRKGWRALLPCPDTALLALANVADDQPVFVGKRGETTVGKLKALAQNEEQKKILGALKATREQLEAELGIEEEDIVPVPALFENGLAVIPNPVNSLVVGKTVFVPDPCFTPLRRALASPLSSLGLTVHFLDIWEPYHTASGELHCGTNALRSKPPRR